MPHPTHLDRYRDHLHSTLNYKGHINLDVSRLGTLCGILLWDVVSKLKPLEQDYQLIDSLPHLKRELEQLRTTYQGTIDEALMISSHGLTHLKICATGDPTARLELSAGLSDIHKGETEGKKACMYQQRIFEIEGIISHAKQTLHEHTRPQSRIYQPTLTLIESMGIAEQNKLPPIDIGGRINVEMIRQICKSARWLGIHYGQQIAPEVERYFHATNGDSHR